ncbi:unnamed protein product [Bursaphelenchus okinawaensis]|uniref:Cleavage and polyadenylation specificity factor subunit 2 n=1 Tax=Bursaphelenchus okinawaensis TaxID=465554 RepID=A0A811LPF9_9BILA|nr:unnamed protein product [Bursaphelenchus okinawaensis]CAG9125371.1 unnamed protein product [Bursaphelenchus okinawaensis]
MTSIIKLEPLSGAQDNGPLCYLLQVDQVYILLDCGWNEHFDMSFINALKPRISQINAVLITYADINHLGALPYLVAKCGLKCPIYATLPVQQMGKLFLYDWVTSHENAEDFELFNCDDVDAVFNRIQYVKYGQIINLKGDNGLQVMPLSAGHMIGGAIWRITKMGDEEIVYAVDFNHRKERHLMASTFEGVVRPHLLITDAYSTVVQRRKVRDEALFSKLISTLREGGDAVIVTDTAGRILEIAHLLEKIWQQRETGLSGYNLVMLSNVASSVIDVAKNQLEWMSDSILKACETGQENPFELRSLKFCHSLSDLLRVRSPKVVLVSGMDMECGLSRELFLESCADSKNLVIMTGRASDDTLGSKLIDISRQKDKVNQTVTLEIKKRIRLEGSELEAYKAAKKLQEQDEARQRLENVRRNPRIDNSESSEDSDDEDENFNVSRARLLNAENGESNGVREQSNKYDLLARFEQHQKVSFFKQSKRQFAMFPYTEEKQRWDDYGEIIRPEDYTKADTVNTTLNPTRMKKEEEMKDEDTEDEEQDMVMEKWPTKCVKYTQTFEVFCKVDFIDLEGRADSESVQKIIGQIKPKQLVLIHGNEKNTKSLSEACDKQKAVQERIFTPAIGEIIDLTIETHIFQVTLSDQLMSSLVFQTVREVELSWVDAKIKKRKVKNNVDMSMAVLAEELMEIEKQQGLGNNEQLCLEILPSNNIPSHEAVFVNDPKLSDLKTFLSKNGFAAEFSSGELYVNDALKISRTAGRFIVEGPACEEYYRVRDIVYTQFAIV